MLLRVSILCMNPKKIDCWVVRGGAQVYVIGDVGIEEELDLLGIQHLGGPSDGDKAVDLQPGYALPHDKDVSPRTCTPSRRLPSI